MTGMSFRKIQIWRRNRQAIEAERSRRSRDRLSRWEADYNLQTIDALSLNEEYNEMGIFASYVLVD